MNILTYPSFTLKWFKRYFNLNPKISSPLTSFKTLLFFQLLALAFTNSEAATLNVGDYSGANTNMTFNATTRTWSPTSTSSAASLDVAIFATYINDGNVTVSNTAGDIIFEVGKFTYSGSTGKTLTLSSSGNIELSSVLTSGTALIYSVTATGSLTISASGLKTYGGSFTSNGVNYVSTGGALSTEGTSSNGNVTLNHTGTITVSGGGIATGGGNFSSIGGTIGSLGSLNTKGGSFYHNGGNITINQGGVTTASANTSDPNAKGGDVFIESTGAVSISSNGVTTGSSTIKGGNFTSSGVSFSAINGSIKTYGGDVTIDHTGGVTVGSLHTGGGNFSSTGTTMSLTEGGITTSGGNVEFLHSGAVVMASLSTTGGNFYSSGTTFTASSGSVSTLKTVSGVESGGSITFKHSGNVVIASGGVLTGGGNFESTGQGSITIQHTGLNISKAAKARIVHAGISIADGGLTGTNESAEILLHGGCNSVSILASNLAGNLNIVGSSLTTNYINNTAGGKLNISAITTSDITLNKYIQTKGGNLVMHALGKIEIKNNTTGDGNPAPSKGIATLGGNLELKSKSSITSEATTQLTTAPGSGGVLTQTPNPSGSITLAVAPMVGAGNITLVTDPSLTIPFGVGATEICNGIDDDCDGTIDEGLSCSPLPVRLVLFSATKEEQSVALQWTTAAESNSNRFDVERSSNGKNWSRLGSRDAANESSQNFYYSYTDNKPLKGANIYRLKMIDNDGTFSYSRLQEVHFGKGSEITVTTSPNPSADKVTVKVSNGYTVKAIQLLNINGQVVENYANQSDNTISIKNLTTGIYFLQVTLNDGSVLSHKVVRE